MLGGGLLACVFVSVTYVPMANAAAINSCMPFFTFVMAAVVLKERFGLFRFFVSCLLVTGVLLVTKPPFLFSKGQSATKSEGDDDQKVYQLAVGYTTAVLVPFLIALISIVTRQCSENRVPVWTVLLWFGLGAVIVVALQVAVKMDIRTLYTLTSNQAWSAVGIAALGVGGNVVYNFSIE